MRIGTAMVGCAAALGSCSMLGIGPDEEPTRSAQPPRPKGPLVKKGVFTNYDPSPMPVAIHGVERHPDRAVLRMTVTAPFSRPTSETWGISLASNGSFGSVRMIDPLGRKLYWPMNDDDGTIGTHMGYSWSKGATYEVALHFPALPPSTRTVSILTPGTTGEYTGVPVIPPGRPLKPNADEYTDADPGETVVWPIHDKPAGKVNRPVYTLYDISPGQARQTETTGQDEKVALRTDVLFAFDKAKLSPRANAVLDQVAAETRRKADPAKPPIRIVGHTDGTGTPSYNLPLSRRRAEAVRRALQAKLGSAYQYQTAGKGETEPIAKEGGTDDKQARARNRRVEIAYKIKRSTPGTGQTSAPGRAPTGDAPPAAFRPSDGPVVGRRTVNATELRVHPFYRDGHYLVAVFETRNPPEDGHGTPAWSDPNLSGAVFGAFRVRDPRTGTEYATVRSGAEDPGRLEEWADPIKWPFALSEGAVNRGYIYVAAPPLGVDRVDFVAGPYGTFRNVPIR